jgi:hypothetical protein
MGFRKGCVRFMFVMSFSMRRVHTFFAVCDGMCECGVILGSQVGWPMSLEDGLLKMSYTLIVFVCAPNASLYKCFREHFSFLVLCVPLVW